MKSSIVFLFIVLLFSTSLQAQTKKDNTITLTTERTDSQNYKKVIRLLLVNNYEIASKDNDIFQITTANKQIKGLTSTMTILCIDGKIILKGKYQLLGDKTTTQFRGGKRSPMMLAWNDLHTFAKLIPHTDITYSKH
jgi:hypothetical protein